MARTLRDIWKQLVENPWFTLLFASKGVEMVVFERHHMAVVFFALAVVATVVWVLSDAISVDPEKVVGKQ